MLVQDILYGNTEIAEPVLCELLSCPSMQRLHDVQQAGYNEARYPGCDHSRFEHSLGVCLLLRRFQAPLDEQVAGLIHDVSHTVFSHCIDYVASINSGGEQDYQDRTFNSFVRASEIPEILTRHGISLDRILDDHHFPLKETELPDLCADRIDYSLRSAWHYRTRTPGELTAILSTFRARSGKWYFENREDASEFAHLFRELNTTYWASKENAEMFVTVGRAVGYALERSYLHRTDLYGKDNDVLTVMRTAANTDQQLALLLERMDDPEPCIADPDQYNERVLCKSRIVDPLFMKDGNLVRLSSEDPAWKEIVAHESQPREYFLRYQKAQ